MDNLTLIQTIFGLIQTLAVVITLVILINEYRKLRRETKVSNYTKQVELLKELRLFRINNPNLSNAYTTELTDTSIEKTQYHFFNLIVLSTFELAYINYKENIIDKKTWDFWYDSLKVICKEKTFRDMMKIEQHKIVNPDFLKLVEKIIEEQKIEEQ